MENLFNVFPTEQFDIKLRKIVREELVKIFSSILKEEPKEPIKVEVLDNTPEEKTELTKIDSDYIKKSTSYLFLKEFPNTQLEDLYSNLFKLLAKKNTSIEEICNRLQCKKVKLNEKIPKLSKHNYIFLNDENMTYGLDFTNIFKKFLSSIDVPLSDKLVEDVSNSIISQNLSEIKELGGLLNPAIVQGNFLFCSSKLLKEKGLPY